MFHPYPVITALYCILHRDCCLITTQIPRLSVSLKNTCNVWFLLLWKLGAQLKNVFWKAGVKFSFLGISIHYVRKLLLCRIWTKRLIMSFHQISQYQCILIIHNGTISSDCLHISSDRVASFLFHHYFTLWNDKWVPGLSVLCWGPQLSAQFPDWLERPLVLNAYNR